MDYAAEVPGYDINALVKDYSGKIFNLAFRILGDIQAAEDVVQDTFLTVYEKLSTFRGGSHIYTWIYRIAVNISLSKKNKFAKIVVKSLDEHSHPDMPSVPDDFEKDISPQERGILLQELEAEIRDKCYFFVMFELTEEQRIVFLLRFLLDLSIRDIAEILEVTESVVKTRLKRAKDKLADHFDQNCSCFNPVNDCRCEKRLGFVIRNYPQMVAELKRNREILPEFRQYMALKIKHKAASIEEIYSKMPHIAYKIQTIDEFL